MIFETKRLTIRKLNLTDLDAFHKMQSNSKVMQFVDGEVKTKEKHRVELENLISKYKHTNNDFWIYALEHKKGHIFIGTVALVKDNLDDEIGYRFLEKYWNLGFGSEVCKGLITYCKNIGLKKLVGYVDNKNKASAKILEKNNFKIVNQFINKENQQETKYELNL